MSKHTPGPWQFYADVPSTDPNWHIVTNESRMRVLANVHIEPGNETDLANAKLIVAAPDLLRALIDLGDWLAYGLNKAAGAEPTAEDHAACERVAAQARAAIDKATK